MINSLANILKKVNGSAAAYSCISPNSKKFDLVVVFAGVPKSDTSSPFEGLKSIKYILPDDKDILIELGNKFLLPELTNHIEITLDQMSKVAVFTFPDDRKPCVIVFGSQAGPLAKFELDTPTTANK